MFHLLPYCIREFSRDLRPPPSILIPDWRGFEQLHPKSSQIGADFSHQASIGVGFLMSQKTKRNGLPLRTITTR